MGVVGSIKAFLRISSAVREYLMLELTSEGSGIASLLYYLVGLGKSHSIFKKKIYFPIKTKICT